MRWDQSPQGSIKTSLREMFERCNEEVEEAELNYLAAREDVLSLNVQTMRQILQQMREQDDHPFYER